MGRPDFNLYGEDMRDFMTWSMQLRSRRVGLEHAVYILRGKRRSSQRTPKRCAQGLCSDHPYLSAIRDASEYLLIPDKKDGVCPMLRCLADSAQLRRARQRLNGLTRQPGLFATIRE